LELIDDHRDALKVKEGEVADLHQGMEELSAAGQAATKEISRLKEDLCCEVKTRSSWEEELVPLQEELARLGEELEKRGSEILEDS